VKQIKSTSVEGASSIQIEFEADIDIDEAIPKVRDKVDLAVGDLPEDADDPLIQEINISELPIMFVSLTGDIGLAALSTIAEDLEDAIEAIRGVLDVDVVGDVEREIVIEVDPERVKEFGLAPADLVTLMRVENVNTPAGSLELGEAKYLMRVPGEFTDPETISDLVVKAGPSGVVYLRDIGIITDGFKETESLSRVDGRQAVTLTVSKRSGENVIFISEAVKAILNQARERLPQGVDLLLTLDDSQEIRDMVSELENNILTGLILVLAVIFVFLGFVNAIFVALAIPVSMFITFIILQMSGVTLNMVVLFSLILALGMLVDNGIVIVENIYRHMYMGKSRIQAAKDGAGEVAIPITTSTLTTVAAFMPMVFWPGIWGEFMVYLPKTVSYALMGSLFVGLVVNPALASVFMRVRSKKHFAEDTAVEKRPAILRIYGALLRLALRWRAVTITLYVTMLVVIIWIFSLTAKVEFVPETEPRRAQIDIDCPEGTNLDTTDAIVRQIEALVEPYRENVEFVIASTGSRGVSQFGGGSGGQTNHIGRVSLRFPDSSQCERMPSDILKELRTKFVDITGAEIKVEKAQMGPDAGPPVNIEISGDDFEVLADLAQDIRRVIKDTPGLVDLRDDYNKGKPEVRVIVDREQALLTGLNTEYIGQVVKAAIDGRKAGDFREGDEEYDVMVRFPKWFRQDLANVENMNITNYLGDSIPFESVARLEQGAGLGEITRIDRKRTVTVSGEVEGRLAPEVLLEVEKQLADYPLPAGYTIDYTGENEDQQETQAFLGKAFVVALFLVALILIAQFNSMMQTLIIMTSVILSLAGVFLGLWIHHMPFGILMTGIGCISLAGVVVNNAIVLLDFINKLRERGMSTHDAIVEAGMTRFRPVMLTAITTLLGLIPMAVGISYDFWKREWIVGGESSQWWGSMAIAVIYGLGFATMLTLVVVPTLYSLTESARGLFHRRPKTAETPPAGS
ncbi:MAG: multidrug efflux pump, partial [Candidatus Hydrogenedentes bacterium]|nr:multidrug efflux pump [Candidatus Hydrogenedentota bacterium]